MIVFGIDTSVEDSGFAILKDRAVLIEETRREPLPSGDEIVQRVDRLFHAAGLRIKDVDVFAAAAGPGSFTGLRIGLGIAKAFAWASEKPVFAFDRIVLAARAAAAAHDLAVGAEFTVAVTGAKSDVYAGAFRRTATNVERIGPDGFFSSSALFFEHWYGPRRTCLPAIVAPERSDALRIPPSASGARAAAEAANDDFSRGARPEFRSAEAHYLKPISIGGHSPSWRIGE